MIHTFILAKDSDYSPMKVSKVTGVQWYSIDLSCSGRISKIRSLTPVTKSSCCYRYKILCKNCVVNVWNDENGCGQNCGGYFLLRK